MSALIEDYGLIGDLQSAALVSRHGCIDWLCLHRFDSPSVFARLLDRERGGNWCFRPVDDWSAATAYVRNTNVLRTEIETGDGRLQIFDFAPRLLQGLKVEAPIELCRLVRPLSGTPRLHVHFDPRPDYARAGIEIVASGAGLEVVGGPRGGDRHHSGSRRSPARAFRRSYLR